MCEKRIQFRTKKSKEYRGRRGKQGERWELKGSKGECIAEEGVRKRQKREDKR